MNQETNLQPGDADPVELVDAKGRPLAVVSASEAHRQSLPHKAVLVLFFDREDRLILGKRPPSSLAYPGRWDLTGRDHVRPGEALADAALRLAEAGFPGRGGPVVFMRMLAPAASTGFEALAVFRCRLGDAPFIAKGPGKEEILAVEPQEMAALAADFRELFAPEVIDAYESGLLFGEKD